MFEALLPLSEVRTFLVNELPSQYRLKDVELTHESLAHDLLANITLIIRVIQIEEESILGDDWAYRISRFVRSHYGKEDLNIKVQVQYEEDE